MTGTDDELPTLSLAAATSPDDNDEDEDNASAVSHCSLYRLDYETLPVARGGEVLQAGDHVYIWLTLYQHHGIVLEASSAPDRTLLIAEFTNAALCDTPLLQSASHSSAVVTEGVTGAFRIVRESDPSQWHKVKYRANPVECWTWRPGTCSGVTPDAVDRVLTRVQFLHTCRHLIPDYHVLASNCEAVAVWCMTGTYTSLQATRLLDFSKATLSTAVAGALCPFTGAALGGLSMWHSLQMGKQCEETTTILNREFGVYSMGKSPLTTEWIAQQQGEPADN